MLTDRRARGHGHDRGGLHLLLGRFAAPEDVLRRHLEEPLRRALVCLHAAGLARHRREAAEVPTRQGCDVSDWIVSVSAT